MFSIVIVSNQIVNKLLKRFRLFDSELNSLKREITKQNGSQTCICFAYFRTTAFLKLRGRFFAEWSKQKEIAINLAEMTITELDESPRQFYAEARNKEGENYSRATLLSLRNGIERFHLPTTVVFPSLRIPSLFSPTRCWTQK